MLTREDGSPIYVPWSFHDEEGSFFSDEISWDQLAEVRASHGVQLLFTKKKIIALSLYPEPNSFITHLVPPSPRPFFSFARVAQPMTNVPEWRYSVFGYELDDGSLFVLWIYADCSTMIMVIPPDEPFPL